MCKKLIVLCLMLAASATIASAAKITYVDATPTGTYIDSNEPGTVLSGNTTLASGLPWIITPDPTPGRENSNAGRGDDGYWHYRSGYHNGGAYLEANDDTWGGSNDEDVPILVTTVSGLEFESYKVYAYFWSDGSHWRIKAGLSPDNMTLFAANGGHDFPPGTLTDNTTLMGPGGPGGTDNQIPACYSDDASLLPNEFTTAVMVGEGNRRLYQAYLGETGPTTAISVYIDSDNDVDRTALTATWDARTAYDGIGYVPEPTTVALLSLGGLALLRKRRA